MHEYAVTQGILRVALDHATRANAQHITAIDLAVGEFSSILDDSVQFYWDMIAAGTIAAGAQLRFSRMPAELTCETCGTAFSPSGSSFACPACSGQRIRITKGTEFQVESIEVE